jgi:hypothetical protein
MSESSADRIPAAPSSVQPALEEEGATWQLPSADHMAALARMDPDVREDVLRIIHRRLDAIDRDTRARYMIMRNGQIFAAALTVVVLAVATLLILMGHAVAGTTIAGIDIVGLVTAFLAVTNSTKKS